MTWFSDITTKETDIIYVKIPNELTLMPTSGKYLTCSGITGITSATCEADDAKLELKITLNTVTQSTGLFKITVENIKNAASLRQTSPF
jgi:hypothetical protein